MALVSVGLAYLRVLRPLVKTQRWDHRGSQAAPSRQILCSINMSINLSPFVGQLCTHCPAGTGDMEANNDSATDEGWEEEMYIKPRGYTEAQVTS